MKHLVNRSETAQDRIHCDTPLGSIMLHGTNMDTARWQ